MEYDALKTIHVVTVYITFGLFLLRYAGAIAEIAVITQARVLKFLPHINDSILLISAIWLAIKLGVSPGENSWLLAKIIALIAYIVAGSFAIKRGKTKSVKLISGIIALALIAYIISVAVTKNPLGFMA